MHTTRFLFGVTLCSVEYSKASYGLSGLTSNEKRQTRDAVGERTEAAAFDTSTSALYAANDGRGMMN